MATEDEYWQAIQERVCAKCLEGDGKGNCRLAPDGYCALKTNFHKVVEVVNSVYSHSIVPYEEALRKHVCDNCRFQSLSGACAMRTEVECALDRYFPLIVEVIEENQRRAHMAGSLWE
ncbi:MAG: hypothetical protein HY961_17280 [Ignavibacteriae bacterium]|nr:hypothetical protein [Ignavibacteriota bacterium]